MGKQSPFNGNVIGFADTLLNTSGPGVALIGIDCSTSLAFGMKCFVSEAKAYYILVASAAVPDNRNVLLALGYPAARWVKEGYSIVAPYSSAGIISVLSDLIDFTVAGPVDIVLPTPDVHGFLFGNLFLILTQKDGTVTVAPTFKVGTNGANDNFAVSQTPAQFVTDPQGARIALALTAPPLVDIDFGLGMRLEITVPATLGTATLCKGRLTALMRARDLSWLSAL